MDAVNTLSWSVVELFWWGEYTIKVVALLLEGTKNDPFCLIKILVQSIAMDFEMDFHGPQRMVLHYFGDSETFGNIIIWKIRFSQHDTLWIFLKFAVAICWSPECFWLTVDVSSWVIQPNCKYTII